jgi:hypothetical protein
MSNCSNWKAFWEFDTFFLHEMLKESFSCCIVGKRNIEFFLCKRFNKFFIHFPWFISTCNNSNTIIFFEYFFFVFGKSFTKFSKVRTCRTSSSFFLFFLTFKNLLGLINVDYGWRVGFCNIESHC